MNISTPETKTLSNEEFQLIKFGIEEARKNILERVKQREMSLVFYLGSVATIIGIVFKNPPYESSLLLIIPFLSLGVTLIVAFHNSMMNALSEFIVNELEVCLREKGISVPLWDSSLSMNAISRRATNFRVYGFLYLILTPAILSLIFNFNALTGWKLITMWVFGLICVLIAIYAFNLTAKQRVKFHKRMASSKSGDNLDNNA